MEDLQKFIGLNNEQINYLKSNPETKQILQEKGWLPVDTTIKIKTIQSDGSVDYTWSTFFGADGSVVYLDTDTLQEKIDKIKAETKIDLSLLYNYY